MTLKSTRATLKRRVSYDTSKYDVGHTKLELILRKLEQVYIHEETRAIKKNDMKAGESSSSIVRNAEFRACYII